MSMPVKERQKVEVSGALNYGVLHNNIIWFWYVKPQQLLLSKAMHGTHMQPTSKCTTTQCMLQL